MVRLTVDAQLRDKLLGADGTVELCDESGRVFGHFHRALTMEEVMQSCPYTDQELAEWRKDRSGRPLQDILADLER